MEPSKSPFRIFDVMVKPIVGGAKAFIGGSAIDLSDGRLDSLFDEADKDGRGFITADEMQGLLLTVHGKGMRKKTLGEIMVSAGDANVSRARFKSAIRSGPKAQRGAIGYTSETLLDATPSVITAPIICGVQIASTPFVCVYNVATGSRTPSDTATFEAATPSDTATFEAAWAPANAPASAPPLERSRNNGWVWHERWAELARSSTAKSGQQDDVHVATVGKRAYAQREQQPTSPNCIEEVPTETTLPRKEATIHAVSTQGLILQACTTAAKTDREVVLAAVHDNGHALRFASQHLKADRQAVEMAIAHSSGLALREASSEIRKDRKLVLLSVSRFGRSLAYASDELRNDEALVRKAVTQCGTALEFASDPLKADRELVLTAIREDGRALKHAAAPLREDREVVLAAVSRKYARCCTSPESEIARDCRALVPVCTVAVRPLTMCLLCHGQW